MRADKANARVRTIFEEWPDVINVWHLLADWGWLWAGGDPPTWLNCTRSCAPPIVTDILPHPTSADVVVMGDSGSGLAAALDAVSHRHRWFSSRSRTRSGG